MQKKIKIGLIGCGRWGKNILRDLVSLDIDVYVAEHSAEHRKNALTTGAVSVFYDLSELPVSVDGYIVAVQTDQHFSMLEILAKTGKPVFIEKPMVPDLNNAREIEKLMGDRVFIMHKWRYHPGINKLAELRSSKRFGKVKRLITNRMQWGQPHSDVDAFWILTPHDLSITLHILGELPDVRAVQSTVFEGNIQGMTALLGTEPAVTIEMSAVYPVTRRLVSVFFEKAVVSLLDPLADHLEVRFLDGTGEPTAETEKLPVSTEYPLLRELKAFVSYLKGGEKPLSSVQDELLIMEKLDSMRRHIFG